MILFCGAEVGEDYAFFGEGFIQIHIGAAWEQGDLSAVLFTSKRLEQFFGNNGQVFKCTRFGEFEIRSRQQTQIGAAPGFVCGDGEGNLLEGVPGTGAE